MTDIDTVTNVFNPTTGETTVTIKYGKGYDEPWFVVKGELAHIRATVLDYFGMSEDEGLTIHELVVNANRIAQSVSAASAGLGGTVINKGQSAWATAAAAPAEPERDPLFAQIEGVSSVDDLKLLRARNTAAFEANEELLAAYKTKGKALTAAAA